MKKNTKIILAAILILALAAGLLTIYLSTRPAPAAGEKTFTVDVVHGDGSTRTYTYDTDAEYLGEVLLSEGLIQGDKGEFGIYITAVDGEEAIYEVNGSYWALYEGEDYAQQGVDQTPVYDGARFSLVYTIG